MTTKPHLRAQSNSALKNVTDMPDCVGCGLCAEVCPVQAINMRLNLKGYITPEIDTQRCINCGLCAKKCVVGNSALSDLTKNEESESFAAWHTSADILKRSSSGGVFSALSEWVLSQKGCIFGVKWKDKYTAVFGMAENLQELAELRGSKYIQAFTDNAYQKVKAQLRTGRVVLFTGTPCQVHALNQFLGKKYNNLITVDIVCHGVPSHHAFRLYVDEFEAESGKTLTKVNFRDKIISWNQFSMARHTSDGETSHVYHRSDDYMRLYLSNKILNDTCYVCPFRKHGRQGDITLGDFWGVGRYFPNWQVRLGRSVVLANNRKGMNLLEKLKETQQLNLVPITREMAVQGYTIRFDENTDIEKPADRETWLFKLGQADRLSSITSEALGHRHLSAVTYGDKNVALFGFWYGYNYGAQLTSLALYRQLEELGWKPTLIAVPNIRDWENRFLRSMGVRFTQQLETYEDYLELNKHFSSFVIGSDQLWRYQYASRLGHLYYLNFAAAGKRRIAYGTSLGTNPCQSTEEYRKEASYLLRFFAAVSSREREGVEVLKKQYRTDAEYVLDPVFLCDTGNYRAWAERSTRKLPEQDYVCSYIMDPDDGSLQNLITYISQREKAGTINMLDATGFENVRKSLTLDNIIENLSTEDWLFYIIHCKHFITNSFHGMCFALMFNKPFTVVGNELRGNSRFTSTLNEFGMGEYLLLSPQDINRVEKLPPIDWEAVNAKLDAERKRSVAWLRNAMEKPLNSEMQESEEMYQRYYILSNKTEALIKQQAESLTKQISELKKQVSELKTGAQKDRTAFIKQKDSLALCFSYNEIKWKYYRYRILSKILFGSARKKYKEKRRLYHNLLRQSRTARKDMKNLRKA